MGKNIKVHSFESLAALDGPGIRFAVFLSGCPLRCVYCHNPDTWYTSTATEYTKEELVEKALRYKPYFSKNGGVTFSGGEPLLQAQALLPVIKELKENNIDVVIDTAGSVLNNHVKKLLDEKPMLLLDIKMPTQEKYDKYISGSLSICLSVLEYANKVGCRVWIRYVVVPGINDSAEDVKIITEMSCKYKCVEKISLLPYHRLGVAKYDALGLEYGLQDVKEPTDEQMHMLNQLVSKWFIKE